MTELPPEARALLRRAASQATVPSGSKARVRAALERSLTSAPSPGAPIAARSVPLAAKLGAVLGAASLVLAGVTVWASRSTHEAQAETRHGADANEPGVPPRPPADRSETAQTTGSEPVSTTLEQPNRPLSPARTDPLAAETRLLADADAALRKGDARAARQLLRVHRRRFANGQLRLERESLSLIAACALAEEGARARAQKLLLRVPGVMLRTRIEDACQGEEGPK